MRYRWNPWQDMGRLQTEMNRLFENHQQRDEESAPDWNWRPNVDIYEDPERFLVIAELPGIDPEQVDLKVEDTRLTLHGTREMEFADRKENYHRLERSYGTFARSFSLPTTVVTEKICAEYKHGLLRITIPKQPEVQPKKISVKVTE